MKTYNVTIKATIVQTIPVEAEDEDQAVERAHQLFDVGDMAYEDSYTEYLIQVEVE